MLIPQHEAMEGQCTGEGWVMIAAAAAAVVVVV